jgi:hypothetical protein
LQVETFGAMAKTEKIAFILEQVHLVPSRVVFIYLSKRFAAHTQSYQLGGRKIDGLQ